MWMWFLVVTLVILRVHSVQPVQLTPVVQPLLLVNLMVLL